MILFPTRGRPWALRRFIENYKSTEGSLRVCVIIDEDNLPDYYEEWANAPAGWILFPNKDVGNLRDALNNAFNFFPNEPFYGIVADDVIPQTKGWDVKLAEACQPHYIAWPNDGIWGHVNGKAELPTHPFIGGDLVRAWKWFSPPYTDRHCSDFIWKDFADTLGIGKPMPDIMMLHRHWHIDPSLYDVTYATQPSPSLGHMQYHDNYKNSSQFKQDVADVRNKLNL